MDNALNSLEEKYTEQKYLLDQMLLWRHTAKAGYPSDTVKAFSFRPDFLTEKQCRFLKRKLWDKSACSTHFNCVRLLTGELKEIPLYPRPTR